MLKNVTKDRYSALTLYMLAGILLIRLLSIGIMGPMPQDAYYFFYSEHLDLSYFDHPPGIAYILWLFTSIFGKNVIAIKLADSIVTMLTVFFFYKLSRSFYEPERALKSVLLFFTTLMVTVLSLVSTPDTPLLLFWTIALYLLHKAIFLQKNVYWIWAGIAMGLAFDSKYSGMFLPVGMILFLLLSIHHRKSLFTIWPWLSCLFFILTISPVLFWNFENNFASFRFQGEERMQSASTFIFQPKNLLGLIGHQSAILGPFIFVFLLYGLYRLIKKYKNKWNELSAEKLFLLCFFLPVFLLFLGISLVYWVKLNWMMPAYISGIIWVSQYITFKWLKIQVVFSFIIHILLAIEVLFYPFAVRSDDTWFGWKELSDQVTAIEKRYPVDFIFSADSYKTAAELNLFMPEFIYSENVIGENALHFDFIGTNLKRLKGKNALFINSQPGATDIEKSGTIPSEVLPYFNSVIELEPIIIKNNGFPERKFLVYLCKGYKPL
ncbi:glycosyltransferase family 39 protein [Pedobacter sp. ASV1-7]|uniref:glycosyltransferase family 39 protein n=1 Tax=Pedobacter sp. ASV1-7 TaxID=3145237 RepID=UPI0032E893CE